MFENELINEIRFYIESLGFDESIIEKNKLERAIAGISISKEDVSIIDISELGIDFRSEDLSDQEETYEKDPRKSAIVLYVHNSSNNEGIYEIIFDKIKKTILNPVDELSFIVIFNDLKSKINYLSLAMSNDYRNRFKSEGIVKSARKKSLNIEASYLSIAKYELTTVNVTNRLGYECYDYKNENSENILLHGHTYVAQLQDIVNIYSKVGNDLFNHNIRNGIKDQLNVDSEIKSTLESKSELFWFLNNGITMVVSEELVSFNSSNSIIFDLGKLEVNNDLYLSVINGAQTINSSANWFYGSFSDDINKKVATVLFRLIVIPTINENKIDDSAGSGTSIEKLIQEITIALNRQKPIQVEDIAIVSKQITKLNGIGSYNESELKEYIFRIVRRGDSNSLINKTYSLESFSRVAVAIFDDKPGSARSAARTTLLKTDHSGNFYNNIVPGFSSNNDTEEADEIEIFEKHYKPINYSMKLLSKIDLFLLDFLKNDFKNSLETPINNIKNKISICNYGRYFLLYLIVKSQQYEKYNSTESDNYSTWSLSANHAEELDKSVVLELIELIEKKWKNSFDSNSFKKNNLCSDFLEKHFDEIKEIVCKTV